jgi:hypothetical protein
MNRLPYYFNNLLFILILIVSAAGGFKEDSFYALLIGEFFIGCYQCILSLVFFIRYKRQENPFRIHFLLTVGYLFLLSIGHLLPSSLIDVVSLGYILVLPWSLAIYFTVVYYKALNKSE